MNRRLKMSMFAVLLLALAGTVAETGGAHFRREWAAWRGSDPAVSRVAFFWWHWRPWTVTRGKRLRTGLMS